MMNETVCIIVPFLNEETSIPHLIDALNKLHAEKKFEMELIFVDDGSTDNSIQAIKSSSRDFNSKIVSLSRNYGAHAAARAGLQEARGDYFVFFPSDLQDPVDMIQTLFFEITQGYDIVAAKRKEKSIGFAEKLFSDFYGRIIQRFAVSNYPPNGVDLIMFNGKVRKQVNEHIEANSSVFLQILSLGFKIKYLEYKKLRRLYGKSKWSVSKKIKLLIDSFVSFSYAPIRLVSFVGILFFIMGIVWSIYIMARKVFVNDLAEGWPMLTSILLLGFGITNIGLGIIAEYLWRTLDASRKRPVFIINEVIDLNK